MPEEKRKINCLIPVSLYDKVEASDYKNMTEAVNEALERLINTNQNDIEYYKHEIGEYKQTIEEHEHEIGKYTHEILEYKNEIAEYKHSIEGYKQNITALQAENLSTKEEVVQLRTRSEEFEKKIKAMEENLRKAPDPVELAKAQERLQGLNIVIEEKNSRISDLTREIEDLRGFAHYFKNTEVKQIEAPGEKRSFLSRLKFW
jgi:chromosome segregation ATPase